MSTVTQQPGSYRHLDEQYLQKYGVRCAECGQLFVGKVLQAREKKYHPSCAKCSRCGGPFIEGDEMCIKGGKIWHLSCDGKRREERSIQEGSADNRENVDNSFIYSCTGSFRSPNSAICPIYSPRSCDSLPNQAITPTRSQSNPPPPRPISSGSFLTDNNTFGRSFTSSFIGSSRGEIKLTGLRGVVSPSAARSPQFHRPKNFSYRNTPSFNLPNRRPSSGIARAIGGGGASSSASSRPSSGRVSPAPPMNNQEPIKLATQPGGYRRAEDDVAPVERDDFPAPPAKNLVEIRIRRKSGDPQKKHQRTSSDFEDEDDARKEAEIQRLIAENAMDGEKMDKVIEELAKMENKGIGNALLKELQKKRAQIQRDPLDKLDPRSASRTANAAREPWRPTRFESAVEASPSRLDPVYIPPEVLDNSQIFQRVPQVGPRSSTSGGLGGGSSSSAVNGGVNNAANIRSCSSVGDQRNIVINMPIPKPGYTLSSTKTSSNMGGSVVSSSNGINDDDDDDVMMGDDDVLVSPLSTNHASPAKMPATILIQ